MATEDAATVLEQFTHNVANMPAEITHLLEEIQAKDEKMVQYRSIIVNRDAQIQKFVKINGGNAPNPKEQAYMNSVREAFDKAEAIQNEKCLLANKVSLLLDRHVKRLDLKIRDLINDGAIQSDPDLPTLLDPDHPANVVAPTANSAPSTGVSTPLGALLGQSSGSSTKIADAPALRTAVARPTPTVTAPAQLPQQQAVSNRPNHQREMSAGAAGDAKRRRLGAPGTLQLPPSNLRQSSAGPAVGGTPKASTPISRGGSVGPRTKKAKNPKPGPAQRALMKKLGRGTLSKKAARRMLAGKRASPSTTGDDSAGASDDGSMDDDEALAAAKGEGAGDEDMEDAAYDEDNEDNAAYCICQKPSFGNMVACDNDKCELEWFHWECVGLQSEPRGRWLCPICEKKPKSEIKLAR